jgi:2-polyprenyl-6-methoxyphenol hydroxylase-like FAD-dependent oxidoreductase
MSSKSPVKVAIIGAGMSGLAVANGLVNDPDGRFDVQVYDRDNVAFDLERGGYQLRIAHNGLRALKTISNDDTWSALREAWAGDDARAPGLVNPRHFELCMELSRYKAYPSSRPVPRMSLRRALLKSLCAQDRVHFGHKLERFEYLEGSEMGVKIFFEGDRSTTADILIAADGSGSLVNRQIGLNNKRKLGGWLLIQAHDNISKATRDHLPESLHKCGSVLYLGGAKLTGFASLYDPKTEDGEQDMMWNLFWSAMVPQNVGNAILDKAEGDDRIIVDLLVQYLRKDLRYGEELPHIMTSTAKNLRTGLLTSSVKPTEDWRKGVTGAHRVLLLGDAVHPMTPGRGMGANQALTDAGNLVELLKNAKYSHGGIDDEELAALVKEFDQEMYSRAFAMVKASEKMTDLDLTAPSGRLLLRLVGVAMVVVGWGISLLETIGLKSTPDLDFMSRRP